MINTMPHPIIQLYIQYICGIDNNGVKTLFRDFRGSLPASLLPVFAVL